MAGPSNIGKPAEIRQRLRGTSITRQSAGLAEASHINGAKFEPLIPDMNINHGWKIHGDFVKDIASRDDAMAKIGIRAKSASFEIADQSIWDATAARLEKLGIDTSIDSKNLMTIAEGLVFKKSIETLPAPAPASMINGRPAVGLSTFQNMYSNPLDTISMMEVFEENQTQFKASITYGEGREFTGYTQSIENRDKLISSLESRLGDRLEDVNPNILGGDQTEGATKLSNKITGRFTTEYTDVPSAGGTMDWSSQNPAQSKGQAAIDNVMAINPQMRPYIHTGVIDYKSADNLQKLIADFPVFDEILHGPKGYVSPYGTIEDTFSQQGYDYKTGSAVKPSSVTPQAAPVTPQGTPVTPPPKVKGPRDVGKPADIRVRPTPKGSDAASARVTDSGAGRPVVDIPTAPPKPKSPPTTGATTPDPQAVSAKVVSNPSQPAVSAVNQPGGAKRTQSITKKLADDGMQTAKNLASGNARAMGIAGAAALLGVGAYSIRDKSQEDMQRKLNRQRYGEM